MGPKTILLLIIITWTYKRHFHGRQDPIFVRLKSTWLVSLFHAMNERQTDCDCWTVRKTK